MRVSQSGIGGRYSRPSGSLLDHALTLDIESGRSKNSLQHTNFSILTEERNGLLGINEGGETHILSGTDLMNGEGSLSDGDVSPDLSEVEWSQEVLCEVERRARLRSQSQTRSVLRKGCSLDQLLIACELEEEIAELAQSRSQSMPRLLSSSTLQQWTHEFQPESDLSSSQLTNGIGEIADSNSLQNRVCEQENGLKNSSDLPRSRRITHCPTSFSDISSKISRPSRQSLPFSTYPRKRHTASDEMHILQLHIAREEPTTDPVVLLKQYQLLTLGYSVTITSSPYIRTLLDQFEMTTDLEARNYQRSYLLEST